MLVFEKELFWNCFRQSCKKLTFFSKLNQTILTTDFRSLIFREAFLGTIELLCFGNIFGSFLFFYLYCTQYICLSFLVLEQFSLNNCPPDYFPIGKLHPGQFPPWNIALPPEYLHLDNYSLKKWQFFHGYFLFLFHGPIIWFLFSVMTTKVKMIVVIKDGV